MSGLRDRLLGFAIEQDEALNVLGGGHRGETLSGSSWRAVEARKWWAPAAVRLIDGIFGPGHCQRQAAREAARRAAWGMEQ